MPGRESLKARFRQVKDACVAADARLRYRRVLATIAPPLIFEPNMDDADQCLDARGLICPEPLIRVRNRIREMRSGEVLSVVATDPSTERDFTDFCRFMGHHLVSRERRGDQYHYLLRKG